MKKRLALVDDDQNILTSVSLALEAEGYEVDKYSDGEQALQGLARRPADLAILDIKMPRMTGIELLEKLRVKSTDFHQPVEAAGLDLPIREHQDQSEAELLIARREQASRVGPAYQFQEFA